MTADQAMPVGKRLIPPRGLGRGSLWALACLLASAVIMVAVPMPHAVEPVTVGYQADLAKLVRIAPYHAVVPESLPRSWQPVSSLLTVGGANGAGTVTWQLGYMTPSGSLAALAETSASAAAFTRRMTNSGTPEPPVTLAGTTWDASLAASRGQRSLYRTASGVTLVVTGNATWADLRTLAAALRPVTGISARRPA
jgi:Protein of unknown function (DUF4245)